jgi:FtsZ-binding cell division protein ZapB
MKQSEQIKILRMELNELREDFNKLKTELAKPTIKVADITNQLLTPPKIRKGDWR